MLKLSAVILFLAAFALPVICVLYVIDKKRNCLKWFLLGVAIYVVAEACIKLPALRAVGLSIGLGYGYGNGEKGNILYMAALTLAAALFTVLVHFAVIKFSVRRKAFDMSGLLSYAAGFICAYVFIVWGINSVSTAAVIIFDDFGLIETQELWTEVIKIIETVPITLGIILFCADAVKFKNKISYILIAVLVCFATNFDLVFYICCELTDIGNGVGILYLAAACAALCVKAKNSFREGLL